MFPDKTIKFMAWTDQYKALYTWDTLKREFSFDSFDDPDFTWYPYTGYTTSNGTDVYEGHMLTDPAAPNVLYIVKRNNDQLQVERRTHAYGNVQASIIGIVNLMMLNPSVVGHVTTHPSLLNE